MALGARAGGMKVLERVRRMASLRQLGRSSGAFGLVFVSVMATATGCGGARTSAPLQSASPGVTKQPREASSDQSAPSPPENEAALVEQIVTGCSTAGGCQIGTLDAAQQKACTWLVPDFAHLLAPGKVSDVLFDSAGSGASPGSGRQYLQCVFEGVTSTGGVSEQADFVIPDGLDYTGVVGHGTSCRYVQAGKKATICPSSSGIAGDEADVLTPNGWNVELQLSFGDGNGHPIVGLNAHDTQPQVITILQHAAAVLEGS